MRLLAYVLAIVGVVQAIAVVAGIYGWLFLTWLAARGSWVLVVGALILAWRRAQPHNRRIGGPLRNAIFFNSIAFYIGYGFGWWLLWRP